jgi:hypothetical protein
VGGRYNNVSGSESVAFGLENNVTGTRNFVAGYGNETSGNASAAIGYKNKVTNNSQTAVGQFNEPIGTAVFMVGYGNETTNNDGTVTENRHNIMAVDRTGRVDINGSLKLNEQELTDTIIQKEKEIQQMISVNTNQKTLAFSGNNASATNTGAISLGQGTKATGV